MRTTTLILLLFSICTLSFGQLNTGSLFVAGNAGFDLQAYGQKDVDSEVKTNHFDISLNPKAGYFLKDQLAIGVALNTWAYRSSGEDFSGTTYTSTTSGILFGPFARYYYEYGEFIPFGEVFIGFGSDKEKTESGEFTSETPHSVFQTTAGVGADYFLNEKVAIEAVLKYFYERQKPSGENATGGGHNYNGVVFQIGLGIYFGSI